MADQKKRTTEIKRGLTDIQRKATNGIRDENRHKVVESHIVGGKTVNLDAAALTQDLGYVICRAKQIRKKHSRNQDEQGLAESG